MKKKLCSVAAVTSWFLIYGVIGGLESSTNPIGASELFLLGGLLLVFWRTSRYAFYRPMQHTRRPGPAASGPAQRKAA